MLNADPVPQMSICLSSSDTPSDGPRVCCKHRFTFMSMSDFAQKYSRDVFVTEMKDLLNHLLFFFL